MQNSHITRILITIVFYVQLQIEKKCNLEMETLI